MKKPFALLAATAAFAAVLAVGAMAAKPVKAQGSKPKSSGNAPAPEFTLKDLDGKTVALKDVYAKKVVIIDFWATWCGPCRGTMPLLQKYWEKNKAKVEILSINEQEGDARVRAFAEQAGYKFRILLDLDGSVQAAYRVYGIPTLFVIDRAGEVRYKHVGYRPDLDTHLEEVIKPLL